MKLRAITKRIIIHHSGGPRRVKIEDIHRFHTAKPPAGRGWEDVAYHYVIEEDGRTKRGRDVHRVGAHDEGENTDSIGVCVTGNNLDPSEAWTQAQIIALRELIVAIETVYGPLLREGHRDRGGDTTDCPGLDVQRVL